MRILLIEDDKRVASVVTRGLKAESYVIDVANEGKEGLELAAAYNYDLIILDIMLPGLTGTQILKEIRSKESHIPVLMLTANDSVKDKVAHLEGGADDYLTKPFAFAELRARVKALMRRNRAAPTNKITLGDLEIDLISHQVTRGKKRIDLSVKEYALLEYLASNVGRNLSRTMIIEHVWDQSFEGLTNIVDVYIKQLRAKIDEGYKTKLIHTLRGVGYVLRAE
jgi:heavy metal response regulator